MAKRPLSDEGGTWKFVVLLGAFGIHFLFTAITRCGGVLFSSYQNEFMASTATTSAIASILSAMSYFTCLFSGVLTNRFGCRFTAMLGGLLNFVGMFGSAFTKNIYQMYVMGAITGTGIGITFAPSLVVVAQYFKKNFLLANGFLFSGNGIGLVVFAPLMQSLLNRYGWRGTLLVTGALTTNMCVAGAVFRPLRQNPTACKEETTKHEMVTTPDTTDPDKTIKGAASVGKFKRITLSPAAFLVGIGKLLRLHLLRQSYRFSVFCLAQCTYIISYGCFLIYLVPCATKSGIPDYQAAFLISIIGILTIFGYLLCGVVNKRVSTVVIYATAMFVCGCAILVSLLGVQYASYPYFVVSTAILGFAVGFQQPSAPALVREYVGVENMGSAVGIYNAIGSVADLMGPIVAGVIYDATESYTVLVCVFAGYFFFGFLALLTTPFLKKIEPGIFKPVKSDPV